jgi:hypothetical protein
MNYITKEIDFDVMADAIKKFSPDVEVLSSDIPDHIASDHRPHIAEVRIK